MMAGFATRPFHDVWRVRTNAGLSDLLYNYDSAVLESLNT